MSKLIIVEGIDNCGKDYVCDIINSIIKKRDNTINSPDWCTSIVNIHCLKPVFNDNTRKSSMKMELAAGEKYSDIMKRAVETCFSGHDNYVVMNRSFLGEAVYAPMYRNVEKQHTDMMLTMVEASVKNKLHEMFPEWHSAGAFMRDNIICINCSCPAEWCVKHEDGKSQSAGDANKVKEELHRFRDVTSSAGWMRVVNLDTTVTGSDGVTYWKSDEQLHSELTNAIFQ